MTYPCAKGAAVHSILCLCSKLRVYVRGSRARLGDRGQQRKKKEEQGSPRDLESPRLRQEDAQGVGGGLRAKLGSPQSWPEKGSHTISLPEQEEEVRGGGKPQNRALNCSSNRKEKLVVQGSC